MLLDIRTIITNTTGKDGRRPKPVRLPLSLGRGSTLPTPGSKLVVDGHLESLAKHTARKGKGRVAAQVLRDLMAEGSIELTHEVQQGTTWTCIEDILGRRVTVSPPRLVVKPRPELVVEPEPEPVVEVEVEATAVTATDVVPADPEEFISPVTEEAEELKPESIVERVELVVSDVGKLEDVLPDLTEADEEPIKIMAPAEKPYIQPELFEKPEVVEDEPAIEADAELPVDLGGEDDDQPVIGDQ